MSAQPAGPPAAAIPTPEARPAADDSPLLDTADPGLNSSRATYLDTATAGLPVPATTRAMLEAVQRWSAGKADMGEWDESVMRSRALIAEIIGVRPADVALGSQLSVFTGGVAASLPDGARVLCAEGDFTSVTYPFLLAGRGVSVEFAPVERLVDALTPQHDLVAVSAVQSADGRVIDLAGLAARAAELHVRSYLDITQACGWLPVAAPDFDFVSGSAYKWLMCPRGTAFMAVRPETLADVPALAAGWYSGESVWESLYGAEPRLATDARRLDVSPAWLNWLGAEEGLRWVAETGVERIRAHDMRLAGEFCEVVGLAAPESPIVSLDLTERCVSDLRESGFPISSRGGRSRLSFHVYNSPREVRRAARIVRAHR